MIETVKVAICLAVATTRRMSATESGLRAKSSRSGDDNGCAARWSLSIPVAFGGLPPIPVRFVGERNDVDVTIPVAGRHLLGQNRPVWWVVPV